MISTPLIALVIPPLQAAAIVQPILIVQDAISAWVYRRDYSAWNLKVLMVGGAIGVGAAWLLATYLSDAHVRIMVGVIGVAFVLYTLARPRAGGAEAAAGGSRRVLGRDDRASPRRWRRPARRHSRCSCCRRSSTK